MTKPHEQHQFDILYMPQNLFEGNTYKYILTGIDVVSRYKVAKPIKIKGSSEVAFVLEAIYKRGGVFRYPKAFQCDNGSEFKNEVAKLLEKHTVDVRRATTKYKHTHTPFMEAFNRELAKLLFKPIDAQELQDQEKVSTIWVKIVKKAMNKINNTVPSIIGMKAKDAIKLSNIWNLFQEPNNTSNFYRDMTNCMKAWNYQQKTSDLPLSTETIKQTHRIMMDGDDILVGEYRKSPAFAGYYMFTPPSLIERYMEDENFKFHETKKDDPIMAATNLFRNIINIHPFKDENERICHLILAHVLIQMTCCLFPVILSSFHRRGERHYIRAIKRYNKNPSMLYTMILKSFIHYWD